MNLQDNIGYNIYLYILNKMTKTGQICLATADNEEEQMPYRSMIKNNDKQAL